MNNNIFLKLSTLLVILAFSFNAARAQTIPLNNIERAMKIGDASTISGYFGSSIDITINQTQSNYSRTQGQMVLRNFFIKNRVREFDFTHTGNAPSNNSTFCLGRLVTSTGTFKVYMLLKQQADNSAILREIRLQK